MYMYMRSTLNYDSGVETAIHVGYNHCLMNLVNVWQIDTELYMHGDQDKSDENRLKYLAVGSMFPHSWKYVHVNM